MTDPTDVLDTLDWLAADAGRSPATLAALLRLNVPDPHAVTDRLAADPVTAEQLLAFVATAPYSRWPEDTRTLVDDLAVVGAGVLADEPDNLEDWRAVAEHAARTQIEAADWPYDAVTREFRQRPLPHVVAQFRDAGRSPSFANAMLTAASRAKLAPDTFGYGDGITATMLVELAEAGIRRGPDLDRFLSVGLTAAEAAGLAHKGVSSAAATAAQRHGLPREEWDTTLPGMPEAWFTEGRDFLDHGFTWADLRHLVDKGWARLSGLDLSSGIHYGSRRRTEAVTRDLAVAAADVDTYESIEGWLAALETGKAGATVRDAALPPLVLHPRLGEQLPVIARFIDAGLRPSHLNTYRAAGCRTPDDVLRAVREGITPARAKALLDARGERTYDYRPLRLASMIALLRAHADVPTE